MQKSHRKKKPPKRVLALPDLEQTKSAVLSTLTSKSGPSVSQLLCYWCGLLSPVTAFLLPFAAFLTA